MTTEAKDKAPTPLQTSTNLAATALAKLRAADEAARKERKKEAKPDSGFTPEKAGFSDQAWAALSPDARLIIANRWIEERRAELKKAKAMAEAERE
jgi:hypothetical protein